MTFRHTNRLTTIVFPHMFIIWKGSCPAVTLTQSERVIALVDSCARCRHTSMCQKLLRLADCCVPITSNLSISWCWHYCCWHYCCWHVNDWRVDFKLWDRCNQRTKSAENEFLVDSEQQRVETMCRNVYMHFFLSPTEQLCSHGWSNRC